MFSPGPAPWPYSPPYMWWHASTYGMDSFMNRLPAMLTMIAPGEFPSHSANTGAPTNGTVGPHQASSIKSRAAPSFSAARMPSPVLALAPTVHSVVIGARWYFTRICSLCSKPPPADSPPAGQGPLWLSRFRLIRVPDIDAANNAVLDEKVGERGVEQDWD